MNIPCFVGVCLLVFGHLVSGDCNVTLHAQREPLNFTSPNYPRNYRNNENCFWDIYPQTSGYRVVLDMVYSNIEESNSCTMDVLTLYAKSNDNTNTIKFHQICGETRRNVITRNDQHFHVVFKTDSSTTARGFLIRYYETEGVSSCGRSLVATSAGKTFTSPGYPNTYLTTQSCAWTITTEHENQTIVLDTEDSEFESISAVGTCDSDNVTVYDGRYSSDVLGTFCGDQQPVFTSGGNLMRVHLQTNHENNFKGFKIRYKAVDAARCVLTIPAGESPIQLVSPGYPQSYQSGLDCHWIIYAPTGSFITVEVIVLDMETVPLCSNDYLLFKDGSLTSIAPTLARICKVISFPIKSSRNHMAILFHSDNSTTGRGFRLQYFAGSACGKSNISASTMDKYLSSPGYPSLYFKKLNCKWTVSAPTGYIIEVYIMDIYMDQYCWTDYLLLKDGPSSQDALLGRYCGSLSTRDAVSSSNYITIFFNTTGSVRGIKFRLKYKAVIPTAERVCGNRLNAEVSMTNYLTSPGYPGYYGNNVSCTWTISTTNGNKIKVEIMSLSLQLSEGCTRDYLLFVDNSSSGASPLAKYCDTFLKNVVSSSNYMIITFHTDESVTRGGFSLKYTATRGCGEHHMLGSSDTTLIQSPNYPFYYPQNADCEWTVSTDVDAYVIHVKVKYFDLQFSLKCFSDYVQLYNVVELYEYSLGRWCGSDGPNTQSTGTSMKVRFHTDDTWSNRGFELAFTAGEKTLADTAPNVGGIIGGVTGFIVAMAVVPVGCYAIYKRKKDTRNGQFHRNRSRDAIVNTVFPPPIHILPATTTSPTAVFDAPPSYHEAVKNDPPPYSQIASLLLSQPHETPPPTYQMTDNSAVVSEV